MRSLKATKFVVSFPTHTIGGRRKNMVETYTRLGSELLKSLGHDYEVLMYDSELVFVSQLH